MKKSTIAFLSTIAFIGVSTTFAARFPVTIINNTDSTMDIQYTVCSKENGNICLFNKGQKLGALSSGNNQLNILGTLQPKSDSFSIEAAAAINNEGQQIAALNQPCDLPSNSNIIVLETNSDSSVVCKYVR